MRFDARGEWFMVSQDTEGLPPDVHAVVRFDGARSESWSLPQENPEYAVANRKVRSQRIRGNETFTVEVVLSETPIKRTVRTYSGYDPDVTGTSGLQGNPFTYRVDYFTYPQYRTFTFMLELGF